MALITASAAKNASDTNKIPVAVDGVTFDDINTEIVAAGNDKDGIYSIIKSFEANVSNGITTIKQSDESYIDIETIVSALKDNGYRTSYNKRTDPGNYKLCLQVAWD